MTDPEIQDRLDGAPVEAAPRAALTITIQSWATPIVGVVMLLIGLAAGFYAYPLVEDRLGSGPVAANVPAAAPTTVASNPQSAAAPAAEPTVSIESRAALMEFMLSQTKHFVGDINAPVTLIEFSDFQ